VFGEEEALIDLIDHTLANGDAHDLRAGDRRTVVLTERAPAKGGDGET